MIVRGMFDHPLVDADSAAEDFGRLSGVLSAAVRRHGRT
jgi:hypothetical protein